jgi:hypothetical protein
MSEGGDLVQVPVLIASSTRVSCGGRLRTSDTCQHCGSHESETGLCTFPYNGRLRPSKYSKTRLTTGRIPVTVVTTSNVYRYGRRYPYDGTVHTAHTVYG